MNIQYQDLKKKGLEKKGSGSFAGLHASQQMNLTPFSP